MIEIIIKIFIKNNKSLKVVAPNHSNQDFNKSNSLLYLKVDYVQQYVHLLSGEPNIKIKEYPKINRNYKENCLSIKILSLHVQIIKLDTLGLATQLLLFLLEKISS